MFQEKCIALHQSKILPGVPKKRPIKSIFQFNGKREFRTSEAFTSYFSDYFEFFAEFYSPIQSISKDKAILFNLFILTLFKT